LRAPLDLAEIAASDRAAARLR